MNFKIGMTAVVVGAVCVLCSPLWPPLIIVSLVAIAINVPLLLLEIWKA